MTTLPAPQCYSCVHFHGDSVCNAFPEGIPEDILYSRHDHREPYPGDDGILFEPNSEDALDPFSESDGAVR